MLFVLLQWVTDLWIIELLKMMCLCWKGCFSFSIPFCIFINDGSRIEYVGQIIILIIPIFKWKRDFCGGLSLPWMFYWVSRIICIVFLLLFHVPSPNTPPPQLWVTLSTIPSTSDLAQLEPNPYTLRANWLAWRRYQRNPSCSKGKRHRLSPPFIPLMKIYFAVSSLVLLHIFKSCCWTESFNLEKLIVVLGLLKGSRRHSFFNRSICEEKTLLDTIFENYIL